MVRVFMQKRVHACTVKEMNQQRTEGKQRVAGEKRREEKQWWVLGKVHGRRIY